MDTDVGPHTPYIVDNLTALIRKARIASCIYVGSLGFEDRTLGALQSIVELNKCQVIFLIPHGDSADTRGHRERTERQLLNRHRVSAMVQHHPLFLFDCILTDPRDAIDRVVSILEQNPQVSYLIFDFSTMPTGILFPLFRQIWEKFSRNIIAAYSLPSEYTSEPLFFEVGEPFIVSGFQGNYGRSDQSSAWIPVLGFQSETAVSIMKWGRYAKVLPIIAFPGYRAWYVDRVLHANKELLEHPEVERISYASANNPGRTFTLVKKIMKLLPGYNVELSPLGPKPQSLGMCLVAIECNLRVVYAQPWAYNPNYSMGYRETYGYWLRKVKEVAS